MFCEFGCIYVGVTNNKEKKRKENKQTTTCKAEGPTHSN